MTDDTTPTETESRESRAPNLTSETEYDTVQVDATKITSTHIVFKTGGPLGRIVAGEYFRGFPLPEPSQTHLEEAARRVREGEATLAYWTFDFHVVADSDVPESLRGWFDARNPLLRLPIPPLSTLDSRRKRVEEWARTNTTSRQSLRFVFHGKPPGPAATLDSKKRSSGEIWWAFVLMTVCASLEDEWLEDDLVWPAIERNIELTAEQFCGPSGGVNLNRWANPAAYMAALSRIYKAGPELTDEPVQVNVAYPDGPLSTLHANSDAAKEILYGER